MCNRAYSAWLALLTKYQDHLYLIAVVLHCITQLPLTVQLLMEKQTRNTCLHALNQGKRLTFSVYDIFPSNIPQLVHYLLYTAWVTGTYCGDMHAYP